METKTSDVIVVEKFKEALYNDINNSGLSIVPVYYVMKDIMNEIILAYNSELKKMEKESEAEEKNSETSEE